MRTVPSSPRRLRARLATLALALVFVASGPRASAASTNYFTDLTVGGGGYLTGGTGDVFVVMGDFTNASTQATLWSTGAAELSFKAGVAPHTVTFAGADQGPTYFGYVNNFAWGTLRLAAGQSLILGDGNATPGAALYATRVILEGGVAQVANITGNGANLFYDPSDAANAPLLAAGSPLGTYPLAGGGALAPAVPVLKILSITSNASSQVVITGLGVPLRANSMQQSPTLAAGSWSLAATVTPAADGTFTFTDLTAGAATRRFYRLSYP